MDWSLYYIFITFIFAVKISFAILAVIHYYLIHNSEDDTAFAREIIYWKERAGFIFSSSMAILTIMLFLPFNSKPIVIGNEARFLFLVFVAVRCESLCCCLFIIKEDRKCWY